MLLNAMLWLTVTHTFMGNEQSWQNCSNESVLYFEVVFVQCWHQIGKFVQIVTQTVSLICSNYTNLRHKFEY